MTIKAVLFDFDGLILETEGPIYRSWLELFHDNRCKLPLSLWATIIGTAEGFDPFDELERQLGRQVDRLALAEPRRRREMSLVNEQPVQPGVSEYLETARRLGLRTAVVSSSPRAWVAGHLERIGLLARFDVLRTQDDASRTKPDPELYRLTLQALNLEPEQAIALEDSPNGIRSAKAAGIFAVAVPNDLTRELDFSLADLRMASLAELPLEELLDRANHSTQPRS